MVDEYCVVLYVTGYVDSLISILSKSTILQLNAESTHSLGEDLIGLRRELQKEVLRYDNLLELGISDHRSILDEAGEGARDPSCRLRMLGIGFASGELAQRLLDYLDDPDYQAQLDDFVP